MPSTLVEQVRENIRRHRMWTAGERIGVAVSGGADSVVLLQILHRLRSEFGGELVVLHVNHRMRAAESDGDEVFVRSLAKELGLPLLVEHAAAPTGNIEQDARDIRRRFFQCASKEHGLHAVALGHTRSDQAETVLFRLLRGAGLTGLCGMRPVSPGGLIRPLLTASRSEVREWAAVEGIPWREDASNLDTSFRRNHLRLETLPALAASYNPNLETVLAQSAALAQSEEEYWDGHLASLYPFLAKRTAFGLEIPVAEFVALHVAVRRRLIRYAIRDLRGDLRAIECQHVESIVRLCESEEGHNRVIIPGVDAMRSFGRLLLSEYGLRGGQPRDYQIVLELGREYELPFQSGFVSIVWLKSDDPRKICANFKKEQVENAEICDWDADLLTTNGILPSFYVRNWRPGDSLERAGHHSVEKIKTLFQVGKVLLWERKHWPIVFAGGKVAWVRQFGGAASAKAVAGSRNVVRLLYRLP